MIGLRMTERETGAPWEIVGQTCGLYVVAPVEDFATPETVSASALSVRFDVADAEPPSQPSENDGWRVLSDANERAAVKLVKGDAPDAPTPEQTFTAAEAKRRLGHGRR